MEHYNRIFVTEYHAVMIWYPKKKSKIPELQNDLILSFCRKEFVLKNRAVETTIQQLNIEKVDVFGLNEEEYNQQILDTIHRFSTEDSEIYFVHMKSRYVKLANRITQCLGVGNSESLSVGHVPISKQGIPVKKKSIPRGTSLTQGTACLDDAVSAAVAQQYDAETDLQTESASLAVGSLSQEAPTDDSQTMHEKESDPKPLAAGSPKPDGDRSKGQETMLEQSPMHRTHKEVGKEDSSRYQEESAEENLLDQILKQEKKILGYDFEPVKLVKRYSDLENARARLVDCLLKRLIRHMEVYINGLLDFDLAYSQYTELVFLLHKTSDIGEFTASWETQHAVPIRFRRPDSFTILKAEAEYYYQVCDLIYGKDYWD